MRGRTTHSTVAQGRLYEEARRTQRAADGSGETPYGVTTNGGNRAKQGQFQCRRRAKQSQFGPGADSANWQREKGLRGKSANRVCAKTKPIWAQGAPERKVREMLVFVGAGSMIGHGVGAVERRTLSIRCGRLGTAGLTPATSTRICGSSFKEAPR